MSAVVVAVVAALVATVVAAAHPFLGTEHDSSLVRLLPAGLGIQQSFFAPAVVILGDLQPLGHQPAAVVVEHIQR